MQQAFLDPGLHKPSTKRYWNQRDPANVGWLSGGAKKCALFVSGDNGIVLKNEVSGPVAGHTVSAGRLHCSGVAVREAGTASSRPPAAPLRVGYPGVNCKVDADCPTQK